MWNNYSETKILVVEGETVMALFLEKTLQAVGYAVSALVISGEEAIKEAKENKPDLVLMDIKLHGEIDGIETAGKIQSHLNVPVIFMYAPKDKKYLAQIEKTKPYTITP